MENYEKIATSKRTDNLARFLERKLPTLHNWYCLEKQPLQSHIE